MPPATRVLSCWWQVVLQNVVVTVLLDKFLSVSNDKLEREKLDAERAADKAERLVRIFGGEAEEETAQTAERLAKEKEAEEAAAHAMSEDLSSLQAETQWLRAQLAALLSSLPAAEVPSPKVPSIRTPAPNAGGGPGGTARAVLSREAEARRREEAARVAAARTFSE